MPNLRTQENPEELLARSYTAAQKSGLFEKISTICRLFGTRPDKNPESQLYRLVHGEIALFFDGHDGSITLYVDSDLMCCTQDDGQLFVYGAWVNYIDELYQAITMKNGV